MPVLLLLLLLPAFAWSSGIAAERLPENPLLTVRSSPTVGDNVNGPTILRVPDWVERPLGRYYMYFAHHSGQFIRLAYADSLRGPWRVYEPGVLRVEDSAFFRRSPTRSRVRQASIRTLPHRRLTSTKRASAS